MMFAATYSLFIMLFVCCILFAIPCSIGIYVYRDAKSRNMNAPLWTLITILTPTLIGFIVYLLVRSSYSNLKCPNCQATVKEQYVACPNCGTPLRAVCPNCQAPVEPAWKVCPHCTQLLSADSLKYSAPVRKKDNALGRLLFAVILIPVILTLAIGIPLFSNIVSPSSYGAIGMTSRGGAEYSAALNSSPDISNQQKDLIVDWYMNTSGQADVQALRYTKEKEDGSISIHYVVQPLFIPEAISVGTGSYQNLFGKRFVDLELSYDSHSTSGGGSTLYFLTFDGSEERDLRVVANGKTLDCIVTEIGFDPFPADLF